MMSDRDNLSIVSAAVSELERPHKSMTAAGYEGFRSPLSYVRWCRRYQLPFWECNICFRTNRNNEMLRDLRITQAEPACEDISIYDLWQIGTHIQLVPAPSSSISPGLSLQRWGTRGQSVHLDSHMHGKRSLAVAVWDLPYVVCDQRILCWGTRG